MLLVTGATGFLGAQLVIQLLQTETKIRCIKRSTSTIPPKLEALNHKIEWLNADCLDICDLETAFIGITKVYHCAAMVSLNAANKAKMLRNNVEGTVNIVNLCLANGVQKLIHVSSIAALGKSKNGELITENHYWDAFDINNGYAISKYLSEMEVWRGIEEGLNAVIVNPSVILGVDAGPQGTQTIFTTVKNNLKFYTSGGSGFVHVNDVARCMIFLGNSQITAQRYIINSQNYTYKTLVQQIAVAFGIAAPTKLASPFMLGIAWRLSNIKSWFTNGEAKITKDMATFASTLEAYDNQKIKNLINFNFIPVNQTIVEVAKSLTK